MKTLHSIEYNKVYMKLETSPQNVRIPLYPKDKSLNELKNLEHEAFEVSRQDESVFWQQDRKWQNFRVIPTGNIVIAGSSQPDPEELRQIFDNHTIGFDVDLRQEPHGLIKVPEKVSPDRWLKVAHTNISNLPEPGVKTKKLMESEQKLFLHKIKKGKMTYFHISRNGEIKKSTIRVKNAETEEEAVNRMNKERAAKGVDPIEYHRIPILDGLPPTPAAVDKLISIHEKAAASGKGIYFHCSHGKGRTTTAMVLNSIMAGKTAEEALSENAAAPGKNLKTINTDDMTNPLLVKASADRLGLIYRFADYWNSPIRNIMTFNSYMREHPIDSEYENRMMASLSIRVPGHRQSL